MRAEVEAVKPVLAWHFTDGMKLRDGQPLVVGQTYRHSGPLVMCESGLHGSKLLLDALHYAPGSTLSRVELSGDFLRDRDKLVASRRKVLWTLDAERVLHEFGVWCAYGALLAEREAGREPDPRSWAAVAAKRRWLDSEQVDLTAAGWAAAAVWVWAAAEAAAAAAAAAAQNRKLTAMVMAAHRRQAA